MRLIAEVYEVTCPSCSGITQALFSPLNLYNTSFASDNIIPEVPKVSTFSCGICGRTIAVHGNLLSLLSDIEDFNEIEQHR